MSANTPKINQNYDGTVKKIVNFGAFIEVLPGQDGLCHISKIANKRIDKVEDVLSEGQSVKVKVLAIDNSGRISLSIKDVNNEISSDTPKINQNYDGTVKKIVNFGAFIEILPGQEGLCHISKIANERIDKVEDVLSVGQSVKVKVLAIDNSGRISLSIKDV